MFDSVITYLPPVSHLCSFLGTYVSHVPDSVIDPESYSLEKYRQNVNSVSRRCIEKHPTLSGT